MGDSQDDTKALIYFVKLIEKNPSLWNYTLKTYCKSDLTDLAWKEIAAQAKDTEQNCRGQWKNIRTAFSRSLKPPKSVSGRSKMPHYLEKHLSFLCQYMKGPSSSGNILQETEADDSKEEEKDSQMTSETSHLHDDDKFSGIAATVDTESEIVVPLQLKRKKSQLLKSSKTQTMLLWNVWP